MKKLISKEDVPKYRASSAPVERTDDGLSRAGEVESTSCSKHDSMTRPRMVERRDRKSGLVSG